MGVTDLASLKAALDSEKILNLPRMGTKSVEKIKQSLAFAESAGTACCWAWRARSRTCSSSGWRRSRV
jgi:hypothetical protein